MTSCPAKTLSVTGVSAVYLPVGVAPLQMYLALCLEMGALLGPSTLLRAKGTPSLLHNAMAVVSASAH